MHSYHVVAALKRFMVLRRSEDGQDLLEYGLLAALIAVVAMAAVTTIGVTVRDLFWNRIAVWF